MLFLLHIIILQWMRVWLNRWGNTANIFCISLGCQYYEYGSHVNVVSHVWGHYVFWKRFFHRTFVGCERSHPHTSLQTSTLVSCISLTATVYFWSGSLSSIAFFLGLAYGKLTHPCDGQQFDNLCSTDIFCPTLHRFNTVGFCRSV